MNQSKIGVCHEYNDYILVVTSLDSEWSRPGAYNTSTTFLESFRQVQSALEASCSSYRSHLSIDENRQGDFDELNENLYQPALLFPVGHSDAFSLVLVDEQDAVNSLASDTNTTVEELCVAFCPKIDEGSLVDVSRIVKEFRGEFTKNSNSLLFFSRLKFNGLMSLGLGLLLEEALFLAVNAIVEDIKSLFEKMDFDADEVDLLNSIEINQDEINQLKVAILDLQSQEEFGLLIACNNPSVAIMVLARVESLTFKDLFKQSPLNKGNDDNSLKEMFLLQPWVNSSVMKELFHEPGIDECHIFRWTKSTFALHSGILPDSTHFCPSSLFKNMERCIKGFVTSRTEVQISPGHQVNAQDQIEESLRMLNAEITKAKICVRKIDRKFHEYLRSHLIGRSDYEVSFSNPERGVSFQPKSLILFFVELFTMRSVTTRSHTQTDEYVVRHIIGEVSTVSLLSPIILRENLVSSKFEDYFCPSAHSKHTGVFDNLLNGLANDLKAKSSILDVEALKVEPRKYYLPRSLHNSILYLYQNFLTVFSNPFSFEHTLDLFQTFSSLHHLLTKEFVDYYEEHDDRSDRISLEHVGLLAKLVESLSKALQHRLYRAFPEDFNRDMEIDFRGGLNQMLQSSHAVLATGVGLLENHSSLDQFYLGSPNLGIVANTSFEPSISADLLNFPFQVNSSFAIINMDVTHNLHISSYIEILHETFHLIYNHWRTNGNRDDDILLQPVVSRGCAADILLSETFVHLLVMMCISRNDPDVISKNIAIEFGKGDSVSNGRFDSANVSRFLEICLSLFAAKTICKAMCGNTDVQATNVEELEDEYLFFIEGLSRYGLPSRGIPEESWVLQLRKLGSYLFRGEASWFPYHWESLMQKASMIYGSFVYSVASEIRDSEKRRNSNFFSENDSALVEKLEKQITDFLVCNKGRPIVTTGKHSSSLVVFTSLRWILEKRLGNLPKSKSLYQDTDSGEMTFRVSYGESHLISSNLHLRRRKLLDHIVILKTCWGISSSLRGSVLEKIIESVWD